MASKPVKKKAPAKAAAAVAENAAKTVAAKAASFTEKVATASVVPFNPLSGIAPPNFTNFNQTIPSFGGSLQSMESTMNNFKNQYEKLSGDASANVRESVENLTKSSATFAKGAEQILKTITEVAQETSQRNAEAVKTLMASRTLNEFAEAQNKLAQQNFDDAMSAITKLSEMTIKLYSEALEPINSQVTKAMNTAKKNAA